MSVFEAVKPHIGQTHAGYATPQPGQPFMPQFGQQPFMPQPFAQQQPFWPFGQQPFGQPPFIQQQPFMQQHQFGPQQPFMPQFGQQPFMPQPFGQQQPFAQQQPFGPFMPQQPFAPIPPIVADVAARFAPHAVAAIVDAMRAEPAALPAIQATGQLPIQVYPMVLMEIANRIAPVLHAMLQQQPVQPMAYAGR